MFDLRKLFVRDRGHREEDGHDTRVDVSLPAGQGLEADYEDLISSQCRRWGITDGVVTVEVRQIGQAPDGLDVYLGMVRLAQWERDSALRLLLGLPLLESKIRRMVRTLWIGEVSHFGGLWLHASEQLNATGAMRELRELLITLTPPTMPRSGEDGNGEESTSLSISSLQPISTAPPVTSGAPLENRERPSAWPPAA